MGSEAQLSLFAGRSWSAAVRRVLIAGGTRALTALRPLAPPPLWGALLVARSAAGNGPVMMAPHGNRVFVLAPHPDDETIGCGGCLARLSSRGSDVRVLVATAGEASVALPGRTAPETAASRRAEVVGACRRLGATCAEVLDLPDGQVAAHLGELVQALDRHLADFRPDLIFTPWPLDAHPDHQAVTRALAAAALPSRAEVWCYEVWAALPPNRIVDISRWWASKEAALAEHTSAGGSFDAGAHLALARWRSIFGMNGTGRAEAFLALSARDFIALVASASR